MVLELERFSALSTLELPEVWTIVVVGHVTLQLGQVGELFGAHGAGLRGQRKRNFFRDTLSSFFRSHRREEREEKSSIIVLPFITGRIRCASRTKLLFTLKQSLF